MGAKYQVEDFAELDGLEDYHTVEAQWIAPMLGKRDEIIADLRQQLADQQRDFNAKILSVCDELATVTGERDEWKGRASVSRKLRQETYESYLTAIRDRDEACRWASAWKRSAKMHHKNRNNRLVCFLCEEELHIGLYDD